MFFSSEIITDLKKDHELIREQYEILRDSEFGLQHKRAAFKKLASLMKHHDGPEEKSAYAFMSSIPELKMHADEGFEEHHIVAELIDELKQDLPNDTWCAKAKVLAERCAPAVASSGS